MRDANHALCLLLAAACRMHHLDPRAHHGGRVRVVPPREGGVVGAARAPLTLHLPLAHVALVGPKVRHRKRPAFGAQVDLQHRPRPLREIPAAIKWVQCQNEQT